VGAGRWHLLFVCIKVCIYIVSQKTALFISAITVSNVNRFLSRVSSLTRDIDVAIVSVVCLSVCLSVVALRYVRKRLNILS